jgi:hypothetical protein
VLVLISQLLAILFLVVNYCQCCCISSRDYIDNNPFPDNPNDDKAKHRDDAVQKAKNGKGHWKPELASDSEEAVAADRQEHADHSKDGIKELQKKTEKHAEEKHK